MYKVKAIGDRGPVSFACGTPDQAYQKVVDLGYLGMKEIVVVDPAGREWPAAGFLRHVDDE